MSEKRHFKLYSAGNINGDSKNYLRLFDEIDKQELYNEEEVKSTFKQESFIRHLPSAKNYLYQSLLESLNVYNKEKTFNARHSNYLVSMELLFNRGLFVQCHKLINKAKAEALLHEKFPLYLIIHRWETLIYIHHEDEKNTNKNHAEEMRVLELMRIQSALTNTAFVIQFRVEKGNIHEQFLNAQLKALKENFPARQDQRTFWISYYYLSGARIVYTLQNKYSKRYECFKGIKSIMEKSPHMIKEFPAIYHSNSNNLINVQCFLGKYDEAKMNIKSQQEFLQTYRIKRETLARIVFLNTSESELFIHYKTKNYAVGTSLVKKIEPRVKKIDGNFNPNLYDLLFMMAVSELMVKNFKGASKWVNQLINADPQIILRKELQINARVLYIIILFESNDRLFENRLGATKRLVAQEPEFHNQLKILEVIRMLAEPKLLKKKISVFQKYISQIRKESKRANEEALNKQFDFAEWLDKSI